MKDTDLAYAAGLVDGEAYIGIKKMRPKSMVSPSYTARIQIRMVDEPAIAFISSMFGGSYYKESPGVAKGRPLYCYGVSDQISVRVLTALLPFLKVKKKQAENALLLMRVKKKSSRYRTKIIGQKNFPNSHGAVRIVDVKSLSDNFLAKCESLYLKAKRLNKTGI